ncbi:MAG: hypothetical protein FWC19_02500 [Treponema sp.]|nr:hypothetical protein [Treponema sp.]
MERSKIYEDFFSAKSLFITGFLIMPALLFNPITKHRVILFIFFFLLAWLSGKKPNILLTLSVITGIIFFNLLIPYGRVLFSIGPFKITSGALEAGIHRAATFEALVMLSKVFIRQDLKLPGAFGKLLGDSLFIFSALTSRKYHITGKNLICEIDNLMLELSGKEICVPSLQERKTKPAGHLILAVVVLISWLVLSLNG